MANSVRVYKIIYLSIYKINFNYYIEDLGMRHFWLIFIGVYLTFFPIHFLVFAGILLLWTLVWDFQVVIPAHAGKRKYSNRIEKGLVVS